MRSFVKNHFAALGLVLFSCSAVGCSGSIESSSSSTPSLQDDAGKDSIRGELVVLDEEGGEIRSLKLKPGVKVRRDDFFARYGSLLHLGDDDKMIEIPSFSEEGAHPFWTRYVQHYKGVPVSLHQWILREKGGFVTSANGWSIPRLAVDVAPVVREEEALHSALAAVGAEQYARNKGPSSGALPRGLLELTSEDRDSDSKSFYLAYRFLIHAASSADSYSVFVDAKTGLVTDKIGSVSQYFDEKNVQRALATKFDGTNQTLVMEYSTDPDPNVAKIEHSLDLVRDGLTTPSVHVRCGDGLSAIAIPDGDESGFYDMDDDQTFTDPKFTNPVGCNGLTSGIGGTSLQWAVQRYYKSITGPTSLFYYVDGNGQSHVFHGLIDPDNKFGVYAELGGAYKTGFVQNDFATNVARLQFSPTGFSFATGAVYGPQSLLALDGVSHELAHGLYFVAMNVDVGDFMKAGSSTSPESVEISESFADIVGNTVYNDHLVNDQGGVPVWTFGSLGSLNVPKVPLRNFEDPKDPWLDHPDAYNGHFYVKGPAGPSAPDYDAHANAEVMNHWFYLLSEGGSGTVDDDNKSEHAFHVTGIGREKAFQIVFQTLLSQLLPTDTFAQFRAETLQFAESYFGGTYSPEYASVMDAWYAVGVGNADYESTLKYSPINDDNVDPWSAQLYAERKSPYEDSWEFEVSSAPDFQSNETQTHSEYKTEFEPGPLGDRFIAVARFNLTPSTANDKKTYYWHTRVAQLDFSLCALNHEEDICRKLASSSGWSKTFTFQTGEKTVTLGTPTPKSIIHPWGAEFKWSETLGAQSYAIKFATPSNPDLATPEWEQEVLPDGSGIVAQEITLHLSTPYSYQITARGPDDDLTLHQTFSEPSDIVEFETSSPVPAPSKPDDGTHISPWGSPDIVTLSWKEVKNAAAYTVALSEQLDLSKSNEIVTDVNDPNKGMQAAIENKDLVNLSVADGKFIYWGAQATGPSVYGVDPGESGSFSKALSLIVDSKLAPKPVLLYPENNSWFALNTAVNDPFEINFYWNSCSGADHYNFRAYKDGSLAATFKQAVPYSPQLIDFTGAAPPVLKPYDELSKAGLRDGTKYTWTVTAVGPVNLGSIEGPGADEFTYNIGGDAPTRVSPTDDQIDVEYAPTTFTWKSKTDLPGGFLASLFVMDPSDPNGVPASTVYVHKYVGHQYTATDTLLPGTRYRWGIEAADPSMMSIQWGGTGGYGFFTTKRMLPPCGTNAVAGDNNPSTRSFSLGATDGQFTISYQTYGVADQIVVDHLNSSGTSQPYSPPTNVSGGAPGCVTTPGDPINDPGSEVWVTSPMLAFHGSDIVTVTVTPGCNPNMVPADKVDTEWKYVVNCPLP